MLRLLLVAVPGSPLSLRMKPLPDVSQPDSVDVGMNGPLRLDIDGMPASWLACTTPAVTSVCGAAAAEATERTTLSAGTPFAAGQ